MAWEKNPTGADPARFGNSETPRREAEELHLGSHQMGCELLIVEQARGAFSAHS